MSQRRKKKSRRNANERRKAAKQGRQEQWNRPRRPSSETPEVVARYMADIEIKAPLPAKAFEESIVARFGEPGRRYLESWNGNPTDITAALAASLDLAVAVESQFSGARIESYQSWLVKSQLPPPKRIIDVGCSIGINACFYAKYFPNADVVGIDCCEAIIACAEQLAAKLSVENVRFECADATALPEHLADQQFDLVTSTLVAHEIGDFFGKPMRSVEEVLSDPGCPDLRVYARTLSSLLADSTSTLITLERINHLFVWAQWARALHDAGVGIDLRRSKTLQFVEHHGDPAIRAPLLLGSKGRDGTIDADEMRESWMEWVGCGMTHRLEGEMAEAVFAALRPTDFVKGIRYAASGKPGEMRHEIWRYGPLALAYLYANNEHLLLIKPRYLVAALIERMDPRNIPGTATSDIDYCEAYDSPETADRGHPGLG